MDDTTRLTHKGGFLTFSSPSTYQSPPEPEDHFNDPNHRLDCSDFVELLGENRSAESKGTWKNHGFPPIYSIVLQVFNWLK